MLAKRRAITLHGKEIARTPLLVPSFSSKGFPEIGEILKASEEFLDGPILLSAYDVHYEYVKRPFPDTPLLFLDSGGYEASSDTELSDISSDIHQRQPWTREQHNNVLASWGTTTPTVVISYDHPDKRQSMPDQISAARNLPLPAGALRAILLKPEAVSQRFLHLNNLLPHIHDLAGFNIIGVTEKEIGNSMLERMKHIAEIRRALNRAGLDTPIHVFGSLDTISTPLYFVAGADIFDGLTWLRFAYKDGYTLYRQNYGALSLGLTTKTDILHARCWASNLYYLKDLELEMKRFLKSSDFSDFQHHASLIQNAYNSVAEAIDL